MFMFSEDKKHIADYRIFRLETNATFAKDKKYAITGTSEGYAGQYDILAYFADEKSAELEMEKIFAAIGAGSSTYTIIK